MIQRNNFKQQYQYVYIKSIIRDIIWFARHYIETGYRNTVRFASHLGRMMTSWNGNLFRVTGHLCGEFTGEFHAQRPVTRSFDVFFDLRLNKRLSKQSWGRWFKTLLWSLWRHCNRCSSYIEYRNHILTQPCIGICNVLADARLLLKLWHLKFSTNEWQRNRHIYHFQDEIK